MAHHHHHHLSRLSVDSESQLSDHRSAGDEQDLIFQMDNPNSPQLQPVAQPVASSHQIPRQPQPFAHFPPPSLGKPIIPAGAASAQKPHFVVPVVRGYDNDNSAALVRDLTLPEADMTFEESQRAAEAIQAKEESYANTDAAKFEAAMPPPPSPVQKVTVQNIVVNNEEAVTTLGQLTVDTDVPVPETPAVPTPSSNSSRRRRTNACIADFELLAVLGRGAYGKVFQVRQKGTNKLFAMKVLRKDQIKKEKDVVHTSAERKVLEVVHHPFIVNLRYAFQTDAKLYFVLDYVPGGELFTRLDEVSELSEDEARFYAAEVVVALEHLHNLHIIYRDLKPENILIDSNGHIVLTDFGFAKPQVTDEQGARTFCGTVHYMAPEVVQKTDYGKSADWWALGVLIHEMLSGRTPFHAANRKKIQQNIMSAPLNFPRHFSPDAKHLLKGLLTRTVNKRLGTVGGATAVKRHPWFNGVDWEAAARRQLSPPFIPTLEDAKDFSNFDTRFTSEAPVDSPVNPPAAELQALHGDVFRNFSYARSPLPSPLLRSNSAPSPANAGAIGPIVSSSLASPFRLGLARASPSASAGHHSLAGAVRSNDGAASLFSPSSRAQISVAPAVHGPTPFQLDAPLTEVDESRSGSRPLDSLGHSRSLSQFTAAQNETSVVASSTALAVCSSLSPERPLSALSAAIQQRVSPASSPEPIGSVVTTDATRIDAMSSSLSSVCSLSSQSDDNTQHSSAMPAVITASLAPSSHQLDLPSPAPGQPSSAMPTSAADSIISAAPRKPFALRAAAKPFVPFQQKAFA